MADKYWVAQYHDGTKLPQYNPDGSENSYSKIDRAQLESFHLIDAGTHNTVISMYLDTGQRLIFRRRVFKHVRGSQVTDQLFWMVGWQMNLNGRNIQSIAYVDDKNLVYLAGQFREDHPLFYPIVPVTGEV
jgi:hypothetical protein